MNYRHDLWNRENFPRLILNHGNWDICADANGYCAAIPTPEAAAGGCKASHFGDLGYVRATLRADLVAAGIDPNSLGA